MTKTKPSGAKKRERYYKWQAEAYWESMCRYKKALSEIYESTVKKKEFRLTKKQMVQVAFDALYQPKNKI